jgi:hypothetical protein
MSDPLFPTAAQPPIGTLAQVKAYWDAYPDTFSAAWHSRFPGKRSAPAQEVFPHLASSASAPERIPRAPALAAPKAPALEGTRAGALRPAPASTHRQERGLFVDPQQTERGACSPLGGVAS